MISLLTCYHTRPLYVRIVRHRPTTNARLPRDVRGILSRVRSTKLPRRTLA